MEKIVINGGRSLEGRVKVDGMKNAAVAVIFAPILAISIQTALEKSRLSLK